MKNMKSIFTYSFLLLAFSSSVYGMEANAISEIISSVQNQENDDNFEEINLTTKEIIHQLMLQKLANLQLIKAAQDDNFENLIKAFGQGASANGKDEHGNTGSHYATSKSLFNKNKKFLDFVKANKTILNNMEQTADSIAYERISEKIISIFIKSIQLFGPNVPVIRGTSGNEIINAEVVKIDSANDTEKPEWYYPTVIKKRTQIVNTTQDNNRDEI